LQVADFLLGLNLQQYEPAFRANFIDVSILQSLTAEDLREIGVAAVGHRRLILDAITHLGSAPEGDGLPRATAVVDAERRHLTVMFCDLVGSTSLAERLDPEDFRDLLDTYQGVVERIVTRFGGTIDNYMGDGVVTVFGFPQVHEDDAERAVLAALEVIDAVGRIESAGQRLATRVGIATGVVVVGGHRGGIGPREQQVQGEAPNLAARLQGLTTPGRVLIAEGTRRLLGDLFELRDLGPHEIKGISRAVPVYEVLWPRAVESRFAALRRSEKGGVLGRHRELDRLRAAWCQVRAGEGQVVLISGEAGIGKSQLAASLEEMLRDEPLRRLHFHCSPNRQDSPLHPFVGQIARASNFAPDDQTATRLMKLEASLAEAGAPQADAGILAELLSLPSAGQPAGADSSPQRRRELTFQALIRRIESTPQNSPGLVVFEDAHWADPTSLELLDQLVWRVSGLPILLLVAGRPEFHPEWQHLPHVHVLALEPLDTDSQRAMIDRLANGRDLPAEIVAQILERADGIPIFVEELTKNVLETESFGDAAGREPGGAASAAMIPASLRDLLMARFGRAPAMRLVAQAGALMGRSFPLSLLRAVSTLTEIELRKGLARLVEADLIVQRGTPPDVTYTFRHALIQDAAQGSLVRSVRRRLHRRIAEALARESPDLQESHPEIFARHYGEAQIPEQAVAFWAKAGRRSASRSSMPEAAMQLRTGLALLAHLPETDATLRQRLEFLSALAAVLHAMRGYGAQETGDTYAEARSLWERLDRPFDFIQVPFGHARYLAHRGALSLAFSLDEELLRVSEQRSRPIGRVLSHFSLGRTAMFMGRFAIARDHLDTALALYDPVSLESLHHMAGLHHRTNSSAFLALVLACLGHPDRALATAQGALEEAGAANAFTRAVSLLLAATGATLMGDGARVAALADQLEAVAAPNGFTPYIAQGALLRGWALATAGEAEDGIALVRSGIARYRATGAATWMSYYAMLLAQAQAAAGRQDEAMATISEALREAEAGEEHWCLAELHRRRGGLLLGLGDAAAGEASFEVARGIARSQGAKLFELRACSDLAALHLAAGRRSEARAVLSPVHAWFSEGFDGPDLRAAAALLEAAV
jgi:predicted ATPase/class 3 adenylate cyclase